MANSTNALKELAGQELRAHPRKVLKRPIMVHIDGASLKGQSLDVSMGGMGIIIGNPVRPGTICQLVFNIPVNGQFVNAAIEAKIMNCIMQGMDGFRVGTQFINIDNRIKQIIESLHTN